ncbi:endo alpha-1,4 polygalactosaminidase [Solwaraspora sp. WMMD792]|uniref:endo alpha-1,4 polygalactosaminidase n=1 Tax=Solwaraspora sp. WMMD792 TaxID=3016099 RepID=UPI0024175566|nr:endo alpha-1,4 polygalactosaminidase [Solwaraspora sp. WMMD792]MDG4771832.1 endo alpha-1,4 polygalactosaminidase [Solwaraspora sp. WMMD792]
MPRTVAVGLAVGAVLVGGALFVAASVGFDSDPAAETDATPAAAGVTLPPVDARFDYQIGQPYAPPSGVTVVSRDREASPAAGVYTICYVNAFQVQPHEVTWWQRNHDDLLLRDADGEYVVDGDWNEILLDISTAAKRTAIADIVNTWIDGCAADGFQAVEPDNIDSYDRSDDLLTLDDAVEYLKLLAPHAHAAGLAIGQKNTTELGTRGRAAGLDFAIAEECGRYDECGDYTTVYGDHVIDIEYTDDAYTTACATVGANVSVVRRDLDVTAPGSPTYVYRAC